MHALHLRLPKGFVLEERLARYADAIETSPSQFAGLWATACKPLDGSANSAFREVHLDLGCGKGTFLVEAARATLMYSFSVSTTSLYVSPMLLRQFVKQGLKTPCLSLALLSV